MTALKYLKISLKLFKVSPSRSMLTVTAFSIFFYMHEAVSLSKGLKKFATLCLLFQSILYPDSCNIS